jgi:acetyl esterase/lipase
MKIMVILLTCLALVGCGIGYASSWSLLGLLNLADKASSSDRAELVVRGEDYGALPRQKLNIWRPVTKADGKLPVLVFFYGGGWHSGGRDFYDFLGRSFAARGFLVIIPDYRLYPEVQFPAFAEDAALALAWTQKNAAKFGGDPARLALAGQSAGAHIAALVTLDKRYLEKAGGSADMIRAFVGMCGPYDFLPFTSDSARNALGNAPDLIQTQPITFARADAPPMLLLTGDADTTVKPRNTKALADAQRALGSDVSVKLYPGLNHTDPIKVIAAPFRRQAPVLDDVATFLTKSLAPQEAR